MMKFNCSCINLLIAVILLVPFSVYAAWNGTKIPVKAYCLDDQCSKPVARGEITLSFLSDDACVLSSKPPSKITIYSRSDNKKLYPLVEINGKRGFYPPNLFREIAKTVENEEVNIPVEFKCSDNQVTITKAAENESSLSSSEASDIISSNGSTTTSSQETPTVPTTPLKEQGSKGSFFAHASVAEVSESQHSGYAPGHSPDFPSSKEQADEITSGPASSGDSPSGDSSQPSSDNKKADAELNINNVHNKASIKSEKVEDPTDESSTKEKLDISAGMEGDDDEEDDDDDDDGIDVDSENIPYSAPTVASSQSSVYDKTETVDMVSSTPQVHLPTSVEGSLGIGTPPQTPAVPLTHLPQATISGTHVDIQSSKPVMAGISPSEAHLADPIQSDLKQEEIATTESPKTSEAIAVNRSSPENVSSTLTSLNSSNSKAPASQLESSQAESGFASLSKDATSLSAVSNSTETVSSPTNESLPTEKSDVLVPETPENANLTDSTSNAIASRSGNNTPSEGDLSSSEKAAHQNDTISTPAKSKSTEPDHIQQPPPVSTDTPASINETAFPESNSSEEMTPKGQQEALPEQQNDTISTPAKSKSTEPDHIQQPPPVSTDTLASINETAFPESNSSQEMIPPGQQEALPAQNMNNVYHKPVGLGQRIPPLVTVRPIDQPNAGQPLHQPSPTVQPLHQPLPTGQPPSEPPAADPIQPSPEVQESYSLPPPSSDSQPPTSPHPHTQESLPPTPSPSFQGYPPPPDAHNSPPLESPSPASEEPAPLSTDASSVDPSNLYKTLSPTPFSESVAPGQPTTVEPPVDIAPPEIYETSTAPSAIPEENKAPEQVEDSQEKTETSTSYLDSFLSLFSSSESSVEQPQAHVAAPEAPDQISSYSEYAPQQNVLQKDGAEVITCSDGSVGPDCPQQSVLPFQVDDLFSNIGVDSLMTRIIAAAVTLLLCLIAYFFFENRRMDGSLVARINTLERQLMVLSKENTLLKEECSSNLGQGQLEVFLEELKEAKAARADLEEQVATLERDLDEAAEANMELNQMLAQTLENPKGSADDVLASVERLQAQLDGQRDTIGNMTRSISSKNVEIENLKIQLIECRETISGLEVEVATLNETIANVRREKEDANIAHVEKIQEVQNQLAEALANKVLEESRLGSELSSVKLNLKKIKQIVVAKESEVEALKESFKDLKSKGASEETVGKLFDAVKLHAQVEQLTQERNELEDSLRGEADARKRLEDHVRVIEEEVSKLRVNYEEAQKEKAEAQTRLEVLSNYFKEKETQLKKELDLQEILLAQQRGDENSVLRRVKSLQEEVETYRSQNESLKREILDQERDFKGQMATLEKKSHDNWVSARQAERKLEETRQEASLLRNRLTLVEKNFGSPGESSGVEANGEGGIISPVMGLPGMGPMGALMGPMGTLIPPPPPPIDLDSSSGLPPFMFPPLSPGSIPPPHFIPPLPPPLMAGDRRPPPLGRMSSPPPAPPHFSPPPPHFDRLDRPSQSPSPTYHRSPAGVAGEHQGFRPFAKPNPRKPTDYRGSNLSSGQSNEPMEKTRTNERV